ncbi:MAG: helix-turn-helix transcriptional regulator [Algicola sp.]|nr:helix-turn-helix transcriptional regulator [Algicola sp.]
MLKLIIDFILIVGIVLSIITLLKLYKTENNQLPKKILMVFWFFIGITILHFYGLLHKLDLLFIPTYVFENGSRFVLAVLIYLYVKSLFENDKGFLIRHFAHFVPFLFYLLGYTIPSVINYINNDDIFSYIQTIDEHINLALIKDSYGIAYLVLSLRIFNAYEPRLKGFYSSFKEKDFVWVKKFILLFLIAVCIDLVITISEISFGYHANWDAFITLFFVIAAIGYLGYFGLSQNTLPITTSNLDHTVWANGNSDQEIREVAENALLLERLFKEDKVHLQPDLTLNDLAQKLQISSRELSTFLNEGLQTNFYEKVNHHRVEEAKNILVTDKVLQYKIAAIGELCGFNSKSSFYRIFKNSTGYSPSAYRRMFAKK